jgi:hypothetical protein
MLKNGKQTREIIYIFLKIEIKYKKDIGPIKSRKFSALFFCQDILKKFFMDLFHFQDQEFFSQSTTTCENR